MAKKKTNSWPRQNQKMSNQKRSADEPPQKRLVELAPPKVERLKELTERMKKKMVELVPKVKMLEELTERMKKRTVMVYLDDRGYKRWKRTAATAPMKAETKLLLSRKPDLEDFFSEEAKNHQPTNGCSIDDSHRNRNVQ